MNQKKVLYWSMLAYPKGQGYPNQGFSRKRVGRSQQGVDCISKEGEKGKYFSHPKRSQLFNRVVSLRRATVETSTTGKRKINK
jgi:hypothetical protein